jgi:hypothetical protein
VCLPRMCKTLCSTPSIWKPQVNIQA